MKAIREFKDTIVKPMVKAYDIAVRKEDPEVGTSFKDVLFEYTTLSMNDPNAFKGDDLKTMRVTLRTNLS